MMKTFLTFLMLCLTAGSQVYASEIWQRVIGVGLGKITHTRFITPSVGWLSTSDGSLLRTSDGGRTWQSLDLPDGTPPGQGIRSLDFVARTDRTHCGWAITTSSSILHSPDGVHLETKKPRVKAVGALHSIDVLDARHVWIGGQNLILRTTDGGETWTQVKLAPPIGKDELPFWNPPVCRLLHFWDALHGVGVFTQGHSARISTTKDGGATWTTVRRNVPWPRLITIYCGASIRLTTSEGKTLVDGGHISADSRLLEQLTSRQEDSYGYSLSTPLQYELFPPDIVLATEHIHRLGADPSSVSVTTDGATSWRRLFITTRLRRVQFVTDSDGHAVGGGGRTTYTPDGGKTWIHSVLPTDQDLYGVHFTTPKVGWVAGGHGLHGQYGTDRTNNACIWRSRDGGRTWEKCAELPSGRPGIHNKPETIHDVLFADATRGWIITHGMTQKRHEVTNGCSPREYGRVLATHDSGNTWSQVYYGAPLNRDIVMNSRGEMLASGYRIVQSSDGNTWNNVSFVNEPPRLAFLDDDHAISFDSHGHSRTTTDSGRSWSNKIVTAFKDPKTHVRVGAIAFLDSQVGWCFGPRIKTSSGHRTADSSGIFVTEDASVTWKPEDLGGASSAHLRFATDACLSPSGHVWLLADNFWKRDPDRKRSKPNKAMDSDKK